MILLLLQAFTSAEQPAGLFSVYPKDVVALNTEKSTLQFGTQLTAGEAMVVLQEETQAAYTALQVAADRAATLHTQLEAAPREAAAAANQRVSALALQTLSMVAC